MKTTFSIFALSAAIFTNAQNLILTNVLSTNNGGGNNAIQTKNAQVQRNAPVAPINFNFSNQDNQQTNKNNVNQRAVANFAQNVAAPVRRRRTANTANRNTAPARQVNQMENISSIFVLVSDNNVGNELILLNDNVLQSAGENVVVNFYGGPNDPNENVTQSVNENKQEKVQRKISLPQISLPSKEISSKMKSVKIKTASTSASSRHASIAKKHHKKSGKKIARLFKDKGIKNVKPNYELCFKF